MDSGLAWPVSSEISSGSKSSRSDWMIVLRLLEFVNLPFREAMDAILCICFANVFLPIGVILYQTLDLGLSTGVRKKHPGTLLPFGRWLTYSIKALLGSRSPPFVLQILLLHFLAVGSSFFVFDVLHCHGEII